MMGSEWIKYWIVLVRHHLKPHGVRMHYCCCCTAAPYHLEPVPRTAEGFGATDLQASWFRGPQVNRRFSLQCRGDSSDFGSPFHKNSWSHVCTVYRVGGAWGGGLLVLGVRIRSQVHVQVHHVGATNEQCRNFEGEGKYGFLCFRWFKRV